MADGGLVLNNGSKPTGLTVKTLGTRAMDLFIGKYTITMEDLAYLIEYIFTNTEVTTEYDVRIFIAKYVAALELVDTDGGLKHYVAPDGAQMRDLMKERTAIMES